jgi:HEAT repeat protein
VVNSHAAEPVVDLPMNRDPELTVDRVVKTFPKGLFELWLAALDRPDADTRCKAAATIVQAKERGMTGLEPAIRPLMRELDRADQHPSVRLAAARALVALDARESAASLLKHVESGGAEFRETVEPALAKWDFEPARAVWLDRLNQPPPRHRSLLLAIDALTTVREEKAVDKLRAFVLSAAEPFSYRLVAARALAMIRQSGFETDATKLTTDLSVHGGNSRLLAASLLRKHQGGEAIRLLQGLATDREPAVAVIAVARLVEIDTNLVVPIVDKVVANPDADVRSFGVEVLLRQPSEAHIRLLGDRLSDPHPEVRDKARRALRELADKMELRDPVIEQGLRAFNGSDWRGQEQGIYLLGQLDQKTTTDRLLKLLHSPRPEVAVAAGWGLRVLAVKETLPAVFEHLRNRHRQLRAKGPDAGLQGMPPSVIDGQLAQLVQFIGQANYKEAEKELVALVPRGSLPLLTPIGGTTRAAAIWVLGRFHEGNPKADLVSLIEGRLTGDMGIGPDDPRVRRMSAIALGRMKATQSLQALRERTGADLPSVDFVTHACRWSVNQITGEPLRPPGVVEAPQQDWFLIPLR